MSLVSAEVGAPLPADLPADVQAEPQDPDEVSSDTAAPGRVVVHPRVTARFGTGEVIIAKIVVLDTSALMSDPEGIFDAFPGADMVIPLTVVQELDGLKKRLDPAGGEIG